LNLGIPIREVVSVRELFLKVEGDRSPKTTAASMFAANGISSPELWAAGSVASACARKYRAFSNRARVSLAIPSDPMHANAPSGTPTANTVRSMRLHWIPTPAIRLLV